MTKKTKTITLTIPTEQRLGQAIMNAYRGKWDGTGEWRMSLSMHGYWDIWEQDEKQIQEALDKIF